MERERRREVKSDILLAGDIGGTKTRLGLFKVTGHRLVQILEKTYRSKRYQGLDEILRDFLPGRKAVSAACFGVAGPVIDGTVVATNLPWQLDQRSLQRELSLKRVALINDLVANAYGIAVLKDRDFEVLNNGSLKKGNAVLLSAGTGLGEAILFWDGKRHIPSPSEGGHVDFGPRNDLEIELLQYLVRRFGRVSYERLLSGEGIFNIYQFLKDSKRFGAEPRRLSKKMNEGDPAAAISEAARLRKSRLCLKTLDLFVSIYGAEAGNLALHAMAVGGVYIGGGIAPKIIWKLKDGTFVEAYQKKGRLSRIVASIPVKVILNDHAALLGAACRARELLRKS